MAAKNDLPPDTTTHFIGAISDHELHTLVHNKTLKAAEAWVLLEISSLVHPKLGCYIGNDKLADRVGLSVRRLQEVVAKLTDMGLIRVLWYDGHRRHIETKWARIEKRRKAIPRRKGPSGGDADMRETACRTCEKPHVLNKQFIKINMSDPQAGTDGEGGEGFGIAKTKPKKAAQTDTDAANQLLTAIRKRLPGHPNVKRARPSVWADHITKLRTLDEIPAPRIQKVLDWYTRHMGDDFVPEAYSGESFRKKFLAIEKAMGRDAMGIVTITPEAERVAGRLAMLGWPKGSAEAVPGAVQVCLEGYTHWCVALNAATAKLAADGGQPRLIRLAQHVARVLPAPTQFVQEWMTAVHGRVAGWDGWGGDFTPYLFKPTSKKFRAMGRGWADSYSSDPDMWDRLVDVVANDY